MPSAGSTAPAATRIVSPGRERVGRDDLAAFALGGRRQVARHVLDRRDRAPPRAHLGVARNEQQRDEHRDRVVVDRAHAGQRSDRARDERAADADRDGNVHAEAPRAQAPPRAGEERVRRVEHDRQRHHEARPVEQGAARRVDAVVAEIARDREHHHLHHREQRHARAHQEGARLAAHQRLASRRIVGVGAVADGGDVAQQVVEAAGRAAPAHARAPRGEVDARLDDVGTPREPRLDQPRARAAMEPFDQQRGLARAAALGDEARGDRLRDVGRPCGGIVVGARARGGPPLVVRGEPGGVDRARDRKAAGAAERALAARHGVAPGRGERGRVAAMEADGGGHPAKPTGGVRGGG
jgi:hypothetical protein